MNFLRWISYHIIIWYCSISDNSWSENNTLLTEFVWYLSSSNIKIIKINLSFSSSNMSVEFLYNSDNSEHLFLSSRPVLLDFSKCFGIKLNRWNMPYSSTESTAASLAPKASVSIISRSLSREIANIISAKILIIWTLTFFDVNVYATKIFLFIWLFTENNLFLFYLFRILLESTHAVAGFLNFVEFIISPTEVNLFSRSMLTFDPWRSFKVLFFGNSSTSGLTNLE